MAGKELNQPSQVRTTKADFNIILKFGGGQNSSASEDGIEPHECTTGQNFEIDFKNYNLRNRAPFDLMGTAPNAAQIRGFVGLTKASGVTTMLVQAGTSVYQWSRSGGFVFVGSVASGSNIRGGKNQYWSLSDLVIVTDLSLLQTVLTWDGSSLTPMTHNLGVDFYAKYCNVNDERAMFANVVAGSATPHMIVSSKLSDYQTLSTSVIPASSIGAGDAFYLLTPDLRPINGLAFGFGILAVSSQHGSIFQVSGADSRSIAIADLYSAGGASGYESMVFASNDVLYGKIGRIESLVATINFGDVAANDTSFPISDQIEALTSWELVYNPRTQKVYCHPANKNYIWCLSKILLDRRRQNPLAASTPEQYMSPWALMNTAHASNLNPTAMACLVDPDEGIEYVYWGDSSGRLYRMEGTGSSGDAGSANITTTWRSGLFEIPGDMLGNSFDGYVSYRSSDDATITVKLLYAGSYVTDETNTVTLKGTPGNIFWGGSNYWGASNYWGVPFSGRFRREAFTPSGGSEQFQIEVSYTGTSSLEINEIGLNFSGATQPAT